jgi:sulfatase maturation enzyme AslB (radical SAM superfamily)
MKISEMNLHNKDKVKLHYDITLSCNNRCEYCYALEELDNSKLFDSDTFENFIDQCNKLGEQSESNEPEVHVDILGGEPLLLLDKVFELIDRVKHNNFRIFSNFNFKNKEKIEMLKNFVLTSDKNIQIFVSVHESSNQEILKRNILYIKDLVEITLLLNDDNIDYNDPDWWKGADALDKALDHQLRSRQNEKDGLDLEDEGEDDDYNEDSMAVQEPEE